jgi:hypothetical protein
MSRLKFKQTDYDTRICEICGNKFVADYGFSLGVCWLVTGHAHIGAFMCPEVPGNQHWGCSPEHALQAAMLCAQEHMIPRLQEKHAEAKTLGKSRIAQEHRHLFNEKKPDFHIIKPRIRRVKS